MSAAAPATGTPRWQSLLQVTAPYRGHVVATVVSGLFDQGLAVASAAVGGWLVGAAITGTEAAGLRAGLIVLAALVLPRALMAWVESHVAHDLAFRILVDLRARLYAAFERLAPAGLIRHRSGNLASTVMDDVERLEVFFAHTLGPLVVAFVVPTSALVALTLIHPLLAAVLIPVIVAIATAPGWLRRRAAAQGRALRERLGDVNAEAVDGVQGLREIVTFGHEREYLARLDRRTHELHRAQRDHAVRVGFERAVMDGLMALGVIATLVTAAWLSSVHAMPPALYPTSVVLAAAALAPVAKVGDAARELGIVRAASERIFSLLDAPAAVADEGTLVPPTLARATVSFRDVSFRYAPDLPDAVTDITFDIAAGQTVALVGHSGAGKSTIAHLLLRFWDVTSGAVLVAGTDIRDLRQSALRELVAFVPQDIYLFNASVAENIRMARPAATDTEVEAAARAALAHGFIVNELPDGYDTVVGERGARVSGGQRQRIAIARALLRNAPVLVMDEPVSNLDTESEAALNTAMSRARTGRTVLLIAHRLSTIRAADRLIVLHRGRMAETGTHDQLLAAGGVYAQLVASQFGGDQTNHVPAPTSAERR